jgi:outer membrane lipoprotein-sorting protein
MNLLLAAALVLQDKTPERLIEQLRSDKVEVRGEAARLLEDLGKAVIPDLEKAAGDKDTDVAGRAKLILEAIHSKVAHELYDKMGEKLTKAKTIRLTFKTTIAGKSSGRYAGSLVMQAGNRSRIEVKGEIDGKPDELLFVSNGDQTRTFKNGQWSEDGAAHEQHSKNVIDTLMGPGLGTGGFGMGRAGTLPVSDIFKMSEFKRAKRDRLDDREAQVISFKVAIKDSDYEVRASLWIDTATALPLKRVTSVKDGEKELTITEVYERLSIDDAVGPETFQLPAKGK